MGTLGSATFEHCTGERRDFVIFIEEDDMIPEMGDWDRPNVEGSIAATRQGGRIEKVDEDLELIATSCLGSTGLGRN
jgi:hypothetical protein